MAIARLLRGLGKKYPLVLHMHNLDVLPTALRLVNRCLPQPEVVLPNAQRKQNSVAHEAVRRIDPLYLIERQIKGLSDEERTRIRREEAVPQLESLREWAAKMQHETMPSGKLGEVLGYLITQWPKLVCYVEDPRLAIDTNLAEIAIRPFALGRRNWLFADAVKGAKASAALYSIVSTARANGLEPHAYLRRLFAELPKAKTVEDFEAILPFNTT